MKKLLGLLAATGLVASTGATVVACGDPKDDTNNDTAVAVEIKADATSVESADEITVTFVEGKELVFTSDKTDKSILEVSAVTQITKDNSKTKIKFAVKADSDRSKEVTEKITVKYNEVEVIVYSVKIVAITAPTEDKTLDLAEIEANADIKAISGLESLAAVNEALGKISITGVSKMEAVLVEESTTDVVVTITPADGYTITTNTFTIEGAIKA